jgi:hypothetical protein
MFNFIKSLFIKKVEPMITLNDYLTASGAYPEREKSPELTPELVSNANRLLKAVNSVLTELEVKFAKVSSGFRPAAVNAGIGNAAKKSLHMQCLAVDILDDKSQSLGKKLAANPELLRKHGLFLEDLEATKGKNTNWAHLDLGTRADRPSRIFKP